MISFKRISFCLHNKSEHCCEAAGGRDPLEIRLIMSNCYLTRFEKNNQLRYKCELYNFLSLSVQYKLQ